MITFKRNLATGLMEAYKDGEKVGEIVTMGDLIEEGESSDELQKM